MMLYFKRSIQATFVIVLIFYMTLMLYYRQRNINYFDQQVYFDKYSLLNLGITAYLLILL